MRDGLHLSPAELRALLRVARHDGGQVVQAYRPSERDPIEVEVGRAIGGAFLLFVGETGTVYRVADEFELATRRADLVRRNLLALGDDEIDDLREGGAWANDHADECPVTKHRADLLGQLAGLRGAIPEWDLGGDEEDAACTCGVAGPEPEPVVDVTIRDACPDSGKCHHGCGAGPCFRVLHAEPLSVAGWGERWPAEVVEAERARGPEGWHL